MTSSCICWGRCIKAGGMSRLSIKIFACPSRHESKTHVLGDVDDIKSFWPYCFENLQKTAICWITSSTHLRKHPPKSALFDLLNPYFFWFKLSKTRWMNEWAFFSQTPAANFLFIMKSYRTTVFDKQGTRYVWNYYVFRILSVWHKGPVMQKPWHAFALQQVVDLAVI